MHIPKKTFEQVKRFPHEVEIIQHVWIPMKDGCRLSAKVWLPKIAKEHPVPAILEYIPYRKRDITCYRDSVNHGYFSGHGYACVRVDLRGSGDSEGLLKDEYLEQELDDGVEVLHWIAGQKWCTGSVGMMGKSWGGFNSLQIAARQPEPLKAIITVSSADDRYSTDVHYMGGCLLGDNLSWASEMFAFNACPPDPAAQGEKWRENWIQRLDCSGIWLKPWLEHSFRDKYWKHGSVCEHYEKIQCPVFAISGWADGYSNTVFSLMKHLEVPRLGLVGPWGHTYPHMGLPGPGLGFLQEALQWWDRWLKKEDNAVMRLPRLRIWMQESALPSFILEKRPGHWVGVETWPMNVLNEKRFFFSGHRLRDDRPGEGIAKIQSPLSVGFFSGKWCSFSSTPDLPYDQREEDGGSLVFETEPLAESVQMFGEPTVTLRMKSSEPKAMVIVRLGDVLPDGKVTRVSYGLLNLCHKNGHEHPCLLNVGESTDFVVHLNNVAQEFSRGHRIRISISTSYWPIVWPSPKPVRLSIDKSMSHLSLPVLSEPLEALELLPRPIGAEPLEVRRIRLQDYSWQVIRDLGKGVAQIKVLKDEGRYYLPSVDTEVSRMSKETYSCHLDDYESVTGTVQAERQFKRPNTNWHTRTLTKTILRSDINSFYIDADLDAFHENRRVYSNSWHYVIDRKYI